MKIIRQQPLSRIAGLLLLVPFLAVYGSASAGPSAAAGAAPPFAHPAFQRTWARTDKPLSAQQVQRSWYWGPAPITGGIQESYAEGVGGKRTVQYFDKSRMEINNPNGNQNDPFFVTNGLLTVELISGRMQVGNNSYVNRYPALIPLASDTDDANAPTYMSFQGVSNTTLGDHPAPNRVNQLATATINKAGQVGNDPSKASVPGTKFVYYDPTTRHNIPEAIWTFLNLSGPVYDSSTGKNTTARLSNPWYYTTGLPISEPYWAKVKIANKPNQDVMIQAFERRVVTYVPSQPQGWQVQMGNIGQHYYEWRYGGAPPPIQGGPVPTPTAIPTTRPHATPIPTTQVARTAVIYSNGQLAAGWGNWSYGATVNMQDPTLHYGSKFSISCSYTRGWGGLYLGNDALFNTAGYSDLVFYTNGGAVAGRYLAVNLTDPQGNYLTWVDPNDYVQGGSVRANTWTRVAMPLVDLDAAGVKILGIVIQEGIDQLQPRFYVDNVEFVGK